MHNLESILENLTHKLLWDFAMKRDNLISARRPYVVIAYKKKTCRIVDFVVMADHRGKIKESEKGTKITIEHECGCDTNYGLCTWDNPQKIGKGTKRLKNKRKSTHHSNSSIIKIFQNSESREDWKRLAGVKNPQMRK